MYFNKERLISGEKDFISLYSKGAKPESLSKKDLSKNLETKSR